MDLSLYTKEPRGSITYWFALAREFQCRLWDCMDGLVILRTFPWNSAVTESAKNGEVMSAAGNFQES